MSSMRSIGGFYIFETCVERLKTALTSAHGELIPPLINLQNFFGLMRKP